MDAYEAMRMVFSRIQVIDHDNASKIMGFLLIQDRGDKEMIRLALGPESMLRSIVLHARMELALLPSPPPPPVYSSPVWAPYGGEGDHEALDGDRLPFLEETLESICGSGGDFMGLQRSRSFSYHHGLVENVDEHRHWQRAMMLRSRSLRAPSFPLSPPSPSSALDSQRARMAASLMLAEGGRAAMSDAAARQIYLTFPADSTFSEEDVSNYFSIYGPVQDVRIPYQQKRMFGFVSFVFPETARLVLSKGNPHFVCDARVLVKPYKEKGKIPNKKLVQLERSEISSGFCASSSGLLEPRDPVEIHRQGARMMYGNAGQEEFLLHRKLEEARRAAELRQAIDIHSRRLMGLHLFDVAGQSSASSTPSDDRSSSNDSQEESTTSSEGEKDRLLSNLPNSDIHQQQQSDSHEWLPHVSVKVANNGESCAKGIVKDGADLEESDGTGAAAVSVGHNLPDSPFASQPSFLEDGPFSMAPSFTSLCCHVPSDGAVGVFQKPY